MSSVVDEVMPIADVASSHSPEPRRTPLRRGSLFSQAENGGRRKLPTAKFNSALPGTTGAIVTTFALAKLADATMIATVVTGRSLSRCRWTAAAKR